MLNIITVHFFGCPVLFSSLRSTLVFLFDIVAYQRITAKFSHRDGGKGRFDGSYSRNFNAVSESPRVL
jgi:hypothetical protein